MDEKLCLSPEASGINAVRAKRRNKLLPVVERFHAGCGMQGKKRNLYMATGGAGEVGRDHAISGQHKQTQGTRETQEALEKLGRWAGVRCWGEHLGDRWTHLLPPPHPAVWSHLLQLLEALASARNLDSSGGVVGGKRRVKGKELLQ